MSCPFANRTYIGYIRHECVPSRLSPCYLSNVISPTSADVANRGVDFQDQVHQPHDHHVARHADITLASAQDLEFDLASDAGFEHSNVGPSDGLGSQDFLELDVDLPGDDNASARASSIHERSEDSMSIGVGRDAPARRTARQSMASNVLGGDDVEMSGYSRAASVEDFGDDNLVQFDFGDIEMDFGQPELPPVDEQPPVADVAQTPEQTHSRSSKS